MEHSGRIEIDLGKVRSSRFSAELLGTVQYSIVLYSIVLPPAQPVQPHFQTFISRHLASPRLALATVLRPGLAEATGRVCKLPLSQSQHQH